MKVLVTDTVTGKTQEFSTSSTMQWWLERAKADCFMGKLFGLKLPCSTNKTNRFKVEEI